MKKTLLALTALLLGSWLALPARAEDLNAVKARMLQRVPAVDALLAKKVVGENNQGYLAFVGAAREQEEVVQAENADRKVVYAAIAAKTGATPELVGQRRAQEIAKKAPAGTMLQDAAGNWVEKK